MFFMRVCRILIKITYLLTYLMTDGIDEWRVSLTGRPEGLSGRVDAAARRIGLCSAVGLFSI